MAAASNGFYEIVEELLDEDRNVYLDSGDNDSRNALHYAIDRDQENLDVVNLLIEKSINIDQQTISEGLSPLMIAIRRGHLNIVRQLVDRGASIEQTMISSLDTAVHIACENGSKDILLMLSEH